MKRPILLLIALLVLAGCAKEDPRHEVREDIVLTKAQATFVSDGNDFNFALLRASAGDASDNFVCSPLSVQLALGMLLSGTEGESRREIVEALGFGSDVRTANEYFSQLQRQLPLADRKTTLSLANLILNNTDGSAKMLSSYEKEVSSYYSATVKKGSFSKEANALVEASNKWSKSQTRGLIPALFDKDFPFATDAFAYLVNALYFKSAWDKPFEVSATKKGLFTPESGDAVRKDLMHQTDSFPYYEDDLLQALAMPYGNGAFRFIAFLPRADVSLGTCTAALDGAYFERIVHLLGTERVKVTLPKMSETASFSLASALKQAGIQTVFSGAADLSNMADDPSGLCVRDVYHRVVFELNEEGAEAAAVTEVEIGPEAAPDPSEEQPKVYEFTANRPFVYAIYETSTNALLLLGTCSR